MMGKHVDPHLDWCTVIKENEAWHKTVKPHMTKTLFGLRRVMPTKKDFVRAV